MTPEIIALLIQALLALASFGALVPVFYSMRAGRRKEEASAASELTGAAMAFAKQCETRISDLEVEVGKLKKQLRWWMKGAGKLIKQLVDNGLEPEWDPNGGPLEDEE